jgi:hypothetical protein
MDTLKVKSLKTLIVRHNMRDVKCFDIIRFKILRGDLYGIYEHTVRLTIV